MIQLPPTLQGLKVALVHDWLVDWRGGEQVLAAIGELFPDAPIATLFCNPQLVSERMGARQVTASWLDRIPGARGRHRYFLPLMPAAIRSFRLEADLVISSSHCVAKSVSIPEGARHLSYVHATMRYMNERFDDYFAPGRCSPLVRLAARSMRPYLQRWDNATADNVDRYLANSHYVAKHIAERYHRKARTIPPPVDLARFTGATMSGLGRGEYFLYIGADAPYKRLDLAIDLASAKGIPLWIAGGIPKRPSPPNVHWLGYVPDDELPELYRNSRALIFPGVEDFGLTPLEAQACGRPVIAFAEGGALETLNSKVALFFHAQTVESLSDAVDRLERFERDFSPLEARANAERFSRKAFQQAFVEELEALVEAPATSARA